MGKLMKGRKSGIDQGGCKSNLAAEFKHSISFLNKELNYGGRAAESLLLLFFIVASRLAGAILFGVSVVFT